MRFGVRSWHEATARSQWPSYIDGPIDDEIIEKVSAVIGAWQRLLGVAYRRACWTGTICEGFRKLGIGGNHNPKGVGGFLPGQTGNAGGRPAVNSKLQIWFLSRAREAGEIVVEIAHNKQATKSDAIRLQACREILDRGMGKAPQSLEPVA